MLYSYVGKSLVWRYTKALKSYLFQVQENQLKRIGYSDISQKSNSIHEIAFKLAPCINNCVGINLNEWDAKVGASDSILVHHWWMATYRSKLPEIDLLACAKYLDLVIQSINVWRIAYTIGKPKMFTLNAINGFYNPILLCIIKSNARKHDLSSFYPTVSIFISPQRCKYIERKRYVARYILNLK